MKHLKRSGFCLALLLALLSAGAAAGAEVAGVSFSDTTPGRLSLEQSYLRLQ